MERSQLDARTVVASLNCVVTEFDHRILLKLSGLQQQILEIWRLVVGYWEFEDAVFTGLCTAGAEQLYSCVTRGAIHHLF
ncbi:Hypothetical predicted protein [Paramuricea clavata]|uniref:Uncharacterized protein n=1 Tax=Paramuricea clavata TaxID=317549 RepID=A0A7D9HK80_PARCT|nr:Hypothetical predicted protein [Paramuricea clavata]